MKTSRYDLHVKVPGRSKPFYVVRRRIIDGGFECTCPRWVEAREECRHVIPVRTAVATVERLDPVRTAVQRTVTRFPYHIPNENLLVEVIIEAVKGVL